MDNSAKALFRRVSRDIDFLLVIRANERNIEVNGGEGWDVRAVLVRAEADTGRSFDVGSLQAELGLLGMLGFVFFESDGKGTVRLYRLPAAAIVFLDECEKNLRKLSLTGGIV